MKFPVTVKRLIDGQWQARCIANLVGDVTVTGESRIDALRRIHDEIRYRVEWCP